MRQICEQIRQIWTQLWDYVRARTSASVGSGEGQDTGQDTGPTATRNICLDKANTLSNDSRGLEKYLVKGYKAKYYKTLTGWRKSIKRCQDAKHDGWLYDVTSLFRSRVCKECKIHCIHVL